MDKKFCLNCGDKIDVDSIYCVSCGTKQTNIENETSIDDTSNGPKVIRFTDAITKFFKEIFNLSGVATRAEYWWVYLFMQIVFLGVFFINTCIGIMYAFSFHPHIHWPIPSMLLLISIILGIVSSILSVAFLSLSVRRLHDANVSGHFLWFRLIPFFGPLALIIIFCQKTIKKDNKYLEVRLDSRKRTWIILLYVVYSFLSSLVHLGFYVGEMLFFIFV